LICLAKKTSRPFPSYQPYNVNDDYVIPAKAGIQSVVFEDSGVCLVGFVEFLDAGAVIPDPDPGPA